MTTSLQHRSFATRHRWLLIGGAIIAVIALGGWWFSAYPNGAIVAYLDHARGHHEIQVYGMFAPWDRECARLLETRYGVKFNRVAGCIVSERLASYVDAYNAVSRPRLNAIFGKDVLDECAEDARIAWEREHAKK